MDEKELENFRRVIQGLTEDLSNLSQSISDGTGKSSSAANSAQRSGKSLDAMADAIAKAKKAEDEYTAAKAAAKRGITDFAKSVHSAASSTETGMAKYSAGLQTAGDAVGSFVGQFGILGKATEYIIKGFTMAADAVMKQNDAIFKSYDELGKLGVTLNTSTEEVLQLGIKAGYSSKNLESLYKSARSLDTGLVALGGSASNGVKAFAEIANVGEQARNNFRALGYSQEEVTEMQASYVKQLAQTGGTLAKTPRQLSEESQKYILNLTALAEITGKNVKEQQKAQELALQQKNVNAFINNLEDKRATALANGNKEEAIRLEKQIQSTKAYAGHIQATEDAETAAAKLESLATDGAVVYTKNNAAMAGMGYNFNKVNEALRRGESPMKMYFINAEENNKVQKNAKAMFGENLYRLGETSVGLQKFAGQSNEARAAQAAYNKYLTLSEEERKKIDKMTSEEAIKQLTQDKAESDDRANLRNKQVAAENEYRKAMDQLTSLLGKAVMPILSKLADGLMLVAKGIKWFVELLYTFGDAFDNLKDMFDDFVMGLRENPVLRKLFGLKEVSADERKKYDEDRSKSVGAREKAIAERKAIYAGTAEPAGEKDKQVAQAEAQSLKGSPASPAAAPASAAAAPASAAAAPAAGAAKPGGQLPNQTEFLSKMSAAGISDPRAQANILAQVKAESGGIAKSESLKYTPERLLKMFPKYIKDLDDARQLVAQGEEAIGNRIYGGRMGNEGNEGYKYRGRGLIQLTGKDNYARYSKIIGVDLIKDPDLANDPDIAQRIAVEYFKEKGKKKDLTDIAQVGKAVGYVDIGGKETEKRAGYAQSFLGQIQQAKGGGIFSGPSTGYPVTMHGTEMVIPADFKIPNFAESIKASSKTELPPGFMENIASMFSTDYKKTTENNSTVKQPTSVMSSPAVATSPGTSDVLPDLVGQLMGMMESKLDNLISAVQSGNDTSDKLLKYSRV